MNILKLNSQLDTLDAQQIVAFHIENFFTIPSSLNNMVISTKIDYSTNKDTLRRLIENLVNTYGHEVYGHVINSRPDMLNNIKNLLNSAS